MVYIYICIYRHDMCILYSCMIMIVTINIIIVIFIVIIIIYTV
jgi:hypothetical protein